MSDNQTFQDLILKHFNEPQNKLLAEQVSSLRAESIANEQYFQEMKSIWDASAATNRLYLLNKDQANNFIYKLKDHVVVKPRYYQWLSGIAAVLALIITSVWFYSGSNREKQLIKETHAQVDSLILSDGSKILLAENTTVKYPARFKGKTREVSLIKGQAFFKVSKDPSHPFHVAIDAAKVSVLGTSFNIKFADSLINVAVETGVIRFLPNSVSEGALLTAGQAISYNATLHVTEYINDHNASAWATRKLHFVDMPLEEVCTQLSEYYNVDITLHDTVHTAKKFNAKFDNSSLAEVLDVLKVTYQLEIRQRGETITIKNLK